MPSLGISPASKKIKKQKIASVGVKGYVHDLDPYTIHPTKAKAADHRSELFNLSGTKVPIKSRMQRETTLYTIIQDRRKSGSTKFGRTPQGPHVIPNWGFHHALAGAKKAGKLHEFPVLSPAEYQARLTLEIPSDHVKRPKADVAFGQYQKTYNTYDALKKTATRDESQNIKFAHTINKLVQLDPFGTYSYKAGGAKKSSLSGKGENSSLSITPQVDWPKSAFNAHSAFTTHVSDTISTLSKFGIKK